MKAFIPLEITDNRFVSSTIDEPAPNELSWDDTVAYKEFDQVSVITANSHLVYESLTSNTDKPPADSPNDWILRGKTNRFRMFDMNQGNPSIGTSPMVVVIRPGQVINALAIELKATLMDVTVTDGIGGKVVYTIDGYLLDRHVTTYYQYFFAPFVYNKIVSSFSIPPVKDPVITMRLEDPSGTVEVSRFAVGNSIHLGATENQNPTVDSDNYSKIEWDEFGKSTLTPVPSIPTTDQKIFLKSSRLNLIRQFREDSNATAAFWSALDDKKHDYAESLAIFGVYRNFQIDLTDPNIPVINLSLKGI